jgi:hypothetical protein
MKKILILALSAGALYILYKGYKKEQEKTTLVKAEEPEEPVKVVCPEGQITCDERNPTKCYDPNIRYIVDPCIKYE